MLDEFITSEDLREAAGEESYHRGSEYFTSRRVEVMLWDGDLVVARVRGTNVYEVRLNVNRHAFDGHCTCPHADKGYFCKHMVAVGLAWLAQYGDEGIEGTSKPAGATRNGIREYLESREKSWLVELILDECGRSILLHRRLGLQAENLRKGKVDVARYRRMIREVVDVPGGFIARDEVSGYVSGIEDMTEAFRDLLAQGHADVVVDLVYLTLEELENVHEEIDDEDGDVYTTAEDLVELHLQACKEARPDPAVLAEQLFHWEVSSPYDLSISTVEHYVDILGEEGLARLRNRAESALKIIDKSEDGRLNGRYVSKYSIWRLLEDLARLRGDIDEMVRLQSSDLSHPDAFLTVASTYKEAGHDDEALKWAESGLNAFPKNPGEGLIDFLVDEYHARSRNEEALELRWRTFETSPSLDRYRKLKHSSEIVGNWPDRRERALAYLRRKTDKVRKPGEENVVEEEPNFNVNGVFGDRSVLVEIHLWEENPDAALDAARSGGCSGDLWLRVASALEGARPNDAIPIYQNAVESLIDRKKNWAYREAVELMRKIKQLMEDSGQGVGFSEYMKSLHLNHKRKRNLLAYMKPNRFIS